MIVLIDCELPKAAVPDCAPFQGHASSFQGRASSFQDRASSFQDHASSFQARASSLQGSASSFQGFCAPFQARCAAFQASCASFQRRCAAFQGSGAAFQAIEQVKKPRRRGLHSVAAREDGPSARDHGLPVRFFESVSRRRDHCVDPRKRRPLGNHKLPSAVAWGRRIRGVTPAFIISYRGLDMCDRRESK
jgi:hypothetical protein